MSITSRLPRQTCSACLGTGRLIIPARQFQIGTGRFVWLPAESRACAQPGHAKAPAEVAPRNRLALLRARVHHAGVTPTRPSRVARQSQSPRLGLVGTSFLPSRSLHV